MNMYDSLEGCNMEIMGYPFFVEDVSPNESFRRRDINVNNIVGGTQKVTKGPYIGLDFKVTTHVRVDPSRPHVHNKIFQEMMSKPVKVVSPELGGTFSAIVVITPKHSKLNFIELSISIKEIPSSKSKIPGESWVVPKTKKINIKKKTKQTTKDTKTTKNSNKTKRNTQKRKSKSK